MTQQHFIGQANPELKNTVKKFWGKASCGEIFASGDNHRTQLQNVIESRYRLEPYIPLFANFEEGKDKKILEIGVGMGSDHFMWAQSGPEELHGVDLTERAIEHTKDRFRFAGLSSNLKQDDAENLSFDNNTFDIVYSFGVLHHSPDTPTAINEVHRVLKPGGTAKIMIYNTRSLTGYLLWLRHALLKGKPFTSLRDVYFNCLESPGTKVYSTEEARQLFCRFSKVDISIELCNGDLMLVDETQKYKGSFATRLLRAVWPRWFFRTFMKNHGLFMLITATK